jgi:hypothetical protein
MARDNRWIRKVILIKANILVAIDMEMECFDILMVAHIMGNGDKASSMAMAYVDQPIMIKFIMEILVSIEKVVVVNILGQKAISIKVIG